MSAIQTQVESTKLQSTREILKQFEALKLDQKLKTKIKSNFKSTINPELNQSKISKAEEVLRLKLWRIWIDQTQENKLKTQILDQAILEIKSKADDVVMALQTLNSSAAALTVLHFLIENKLAKISGFVEVIDQKIYYKNPAGQSIPIGNLELTEIEFEKQKIYTHHFKSVKKTSDITLAKIESLSKMPLEKAEIFLEGLILGIKI